jgi:N-methylhydantoinase B
MGSINSAKVVRRDGSVETYEMCTRVRVAKGELVRLATATGGGYGDPAARAPELVRNDVKNGYVTADEAVRDYGVEAIPVSGLMAPE